MLVEDKKGWVKCTKCEEQFEREKIAEGELVAAQETGN
jgi:hypothetical protein